MKFLLDVGISPALGSLLEAEAKVFFDLLHEIWEQIEEPLAIGAFVVIETESVRVRMLPIFRI